MKSDFDFMHPLSYNIRILASRQSGTVL